VLNFLAGREKIPNMLDVVSFFYNKILSKKCEVRFRDGRIRKVVGKREKLDRFAKRLSSTAAAAEEDAPTI